MTRRFILRLRAERDAQSVFEWYESRASRRARGAASVAQSGNLAAPLNSSAQTNESREQNKRGKNVDRSDFSGIFMIDYKVNARISVDQFIDLLNRSTLGKRRPVEDRACMEAMVKYGNLCVTAWDGARLVGVARSLTDFHYACYMPDLAVDESYQRTGIGKALIAYTQKQLGPRCKLRLIAAPAAVDYYPKIGFVRNAQCWELPRDKEVG